MFLFPAAATRASVYPPHILVSGSCLNSRVVLPGMWVWVPFKQFYIYWSYIQLSFILADARYTYLNTRYIYFRENYLLKSEENAVMTLQLSSAQLGIWIFGEVYFQFTFTCELDIHSFVFLLHCGKHTFHNT